MTPPKIQALGIMQQGLAGAGEAPAVRLEEIPPSI